MFAAHDSAKAKSSGGPEQVVTQLSLVFQTSLIGKLTPVSETLTAKLQLREPFTYFVRDGDTPETIAHTFGLKTNTVLWANQLASGGLIHPGDELTILPTDGVLHKVKKNETIQTIAKKYRVETDAIIEFNGLDADGAIEEGDEIVVPRGVMPAPPKPRAVSGSEYRKFVSNLPDVADYYVRPVNGVRTQGLHPYNAVDIANACGTPIVAAAEGTILWAKSSGWNGGYGKVVRIQHPNGTSTTYGHLKEVLVSADQQVAQGQQIALVGTTGRSTGCHLHFEIRGAKNPFAR